jgi:hypothetical protein
MREKGFWGRRGWMGWMRGRGEMGFGMLGAEAK